MITATVAIQDDYLVSPDFEKEIIAAVDATLDLTHKDFEATTRTFRHKPTFHTERAKRKGDTIEGSVWTGDENYVRLNEGVSPHQVTTNKWMSFRPVYTAKTSRGIISSRSGGKSGKLQRAKGPWKKPHPGFEGRQFDVAIYNKRIKDFYSNVEKATAKFTK